MTNKVPADAPVRDIKFKKYTKIKNEKDLKSLALWVFFFSFFLAVFYFD